MSVRANTGSRIYVSPLPVHDCSKKRASAHGLRPILSRPLLRLSCGLTPVGSTCGCGGDRRGRQRVGRKRYRRVSSVRESGASQVRYLYLPGDLSRCSHLSRWLGWHVSVWPRSQRGASCALLRKLPSSTEWDRCRIDLHLPSSKLPNAGRGGTDEPNKGNFELVDD